MLLLLLLSVPLLQLHVLLLVVAKRRASGKASPNSVPRPPSSKTSLESCLLDTKKYKFRAHDSTNAASLNQCCLITSEANRRVTEH
jgi:hypothetical protein